MRVLFLLCICFAPEAWGFEWGTSRRFPSSLLSMTSTHKIDIVTRDITLTDTLKARVESKIGKVIDKLGYTGIVSTNLVLRVHKNPSEEIHASTTKKDSQIAEVTVKLKGNQVIHCTERTEDMYASIDILSHKLALKLKRVKDKVQNKRGNEKVGGSVAEDEEENAGIFNDEDLLLELNSEYKNKYLASLASTQEMDVSAVKKKVFAMPPITLEEAIASLEYVDHPFFVFRNKVCIV